MANYRNIQVSFWTDSKVIEDFTPEDKYFYLYLMTNPLTTLCGCYEISRKQMSIHTGYSVETIDNILYRMETLHDILRYNKETRELLLLNWHKYNWVGSDKVLKGAYIETLKIKDAEFRAYLFYTLKEHGYEVPELDTLSIPYPYPLRSTFSLVYSSVSNIDSNNAIHDREEYTVEQLNNNKPKEDKKEQEHPHEKEIREIISYLNERVGGRYSPKTAETVKLLSGRLNDEYTVEDCKDVIDIKAKEWMGTEMEKFLRPRTLFAPSNFENYLHQKDIKTPMMKQGATSYMGRQNPMSAIREKILEEERRKGASG